MPVLAFAGLCAAAGLVCALTGCACMSRRPQRCQALSGVASVLLVAAVLAVGVHLGGVTA